jgi:hypothetical protein
MKRKTKSEIVDRFRRRHVKAEADVLKAELASWAEDNLALLTDAAPELPEELDDRGQDVCEPLLAIADLAGQEWGTRARRALVEVRGQRGEVDEVGLRVLADVRLAFEDAQLDRMWSSELTRALRDDEDGDWRTHGKEGLTPAALARLLRPFEVAPRQIRIGAHTRKGYLRASFEEAWSRYLPPLDGHPTETPETSAQQQESTSLLVPKQDGDVSVQRGDADPHEHDKVSDVSAGGPVLGASRGDDAHSTRPDAPGAEAWRDQDEIERLADIARAMESDEGDA